MSTLKLNWGTRIVLLYSGFVILIVILVVGSMRQSFDLVTPDYYSQEIKYQEVIDANKNLSMLSSKATITTTTNEIAISFPQEFNSKVLKGSVQFYSPVNSAWDKKLDLVVNDNKMIIERNKVQNTAYTVKLTWQAEGKQYYQETALNLH